MHISLYGVKEVRCVNSTAAGTTTVNGSSIDLQAGPGLFTGCKFTCLLGTLTATQVTKLKAQGSDDNSTWTDLTDDALGGTLVTDAAADADSNDMLVLDIFRPRHRYLRPVVVRGTANAVIDGVIAQLYHAPMEPVAVDATVATGASANGTTRLASYLPH